MSPSEPDSERRTLRLPSVECAAPEVGVWLAALEVSRSRTLEAINGIDQAELDWTSPALGSTIGSILYHIAVIELDWLYVEILEQDFPPGFEDWFPHEVHDSEGNNQAVIGDSVKRHMDRLHYVQTRLSSTLREMSMSDFKRMRSLEPYDVNPEWVVQHLLQHDAEHRGQISLIRRSFSAGDVSA